MVFHTKRGTIYTSLNKESSMCTIKTKNKKLYKKVIYLDVI